MTFPLTSPRAPSTLPRELRGQVVVLDFWTYCCINCMHVLPDLAAIEAKYSGQAVTVVGVHSAKFDNEKDSGAIRQVRARVPVYAKLCRNGLLSGGVNHHAWLHSQHFGKHSHGSGMHGNCRGSLVAVLVNARLRCRTISGITWLC